MEGEKHRALSLLDFYSVKSFKPKNEHYPLSPSVCVCVLWQRCVCCTLLVYTSETTGTQQRQGHNPAAESGPTRSLLNGQRRTKSRSGYQASVGTSVHNEKFTFSLPSCMYVA